MTIFGFNMPIIGVLQILYLNPYIFNFNQRAPYYFIWFERYGICVLIGIIENLILRQKFR